MFKHFPEYIGYEHDIGILMTYSLSQLCIIEPVRWQMFVWRWSDELVLFVCSEWPCCGRHWRSTDVQMMYRWNAYDVQMTWSRIDDLKYWSQMCGTG